eukprot:364798-Chlamydomonas_euryale.AAC.20
MLEWTWLEPHAFHYAGRHAAPHCAHVLYSARHPQVATCKDAPKAGREFKDATAELQVYHPGRGVGSRRLQLSSQPTNQAPANLPLNTEACVRRVSR